MKAQERAGFVALTTIRLPKPILGYSLCSWCKYASWSGTICGEDSEVECEHPLFERISPDGELLASYGDGEDCWGFRPIKTIEQAADRVGAWLRKQTPPANEGRA